MAVLGSYQDPQAATWARIVDNPGVPEAIRTSARDALDRHIANAKKAGISPFAYKGGAEVAEESNLLPATPREERSFPQPGWLGSAMGIEGGLFTDAIPRFLGFGEQEAPVPPPERGQRTGPRTPGMEAFENLDLSPGWLGRQLGMDPLLTETVPNVASAVGSVIMDPYNTGARLGRHLREGATGTPTAAAADTPSGSAPAWAAPRAANDLPPERAPVPATKPAAPKRSGGLEGPTSAAAPAPSVSTSAGLESSTPMGTGPAAPSVPVEGDIRKPPAFDPGASGIEKPSSIDPLAFALMRGGFALMGSDKPFFQALGDAGVVGVDSYVQGQDNRDQKQRDYEEQVRQENEEKRKAYEDTVLAPWIAQEEIRDRDRNFNRDVFESDRTYDRGVVTSDRDYALGKQGVGIQGARLGLEGQRLDIDREQLGIAREGLVPSAQREIGFIAQQLNRFNPSLSGQELWDAAVQEYLKINPPSSGGFMIPGMMGGAPQIPDEALGQSLR